MRARIQQAAGLSVLRSKFFLLAAPFTSLICIGGKNPRCSPETGLTETSAEPASFRRTVSAHWFTRAGRRRNTFAQFGRFPESPPVSAAAIVVIAALHNSVPRRPPAGRLRFTF